MTQETNSTVNVENQNLNNEEITSITICGELWTEIHTTFEIKDRDKFLSLFPNQKFDKDYFIELLTDGEFDDVYHNRKYGISNTSFLPYGLEEEGESISNYRGITEVIVE
jgi:hypothetical protein